MATVLFLIKHTLPKGTRHRRRRGLVFSVRAVKHWNKLPTSAVTALFQENGWPEIVDRGLTEDRGGLFHFGLSTLPHNS